MPRHLRAVTDTTPRAIIYLRQSVARDDSISLELQEIACRDYCDRLGYTVTAVESDPGISGRTWNRPAVQRVMTAIDNHDADVIVLWKWSRLSRSRKDWALAIDRADVAGGKIESATEPIDTATASGRFARGVMTEYAAFQSEQIGEQWEEVRARRLRLGLPVSGRLPFGWVWGADEHKGTIQPVADLTPIIVEMYARYLAGDGAAAIAAWLNNRGIPAPNGGLWSRVRPLTVMDSPIHAGQIPYRGDTVEGQHEAIIDAATWAAYQAERARRHNAQEKPREYQHLLSGVMICACGARMHGKGSVTAGKLYRGYMCSETLNGHPQRAYVSALTVEPLITAWFLTLDPATVAPPEDSARAARATAILREQNALEAELVTLTRQHTRNIIPEIAYVRATADISAELASLEAEHRALTPKRTITPEEIATLQRTWPAMTITAQNRTIRRVVDHVKIDDTGHNFTLRTVWGEDHPLRGSATWRGKRRN